MASLQQDHVTTNSMIIETWGELHSLTFRGWFVIRALRTQEEGDHQGAA